MLVRVADLVQGVRERQPGSRHFAGCARALAEAALAPDPRLAEAATKALFSELVEEWADRFEPSLCAKYAAFMSEVLYARGSPLAAALQALGYEGPDKLLERYSSISSAKSGSGLDRGRVRKVAVLSRITLGADMAVTRPVLLAAASAFPAAEVEFIGPLKNAGLIVTARSIRHRPISYGRAALLADRLRAWLDLRAAVQASVAGLRDEEYLVVDPDSRLTQLGLLPVAPDSSYLFFESRSYGGAEGGRLGSLATQWFSRACGVDLSCARPVPLEVPTLARRCLADQAGRPLAAVSFGAGGRESKRVGDRFERGLLDLLRRRGFRIVLDYGLGEEEACVVDRHVAAFKGATACLSADALGWPRHADLLTWRGSLADFGAWAGAADVYIGYDSAAAHVAAAYGTRVIEAFAGAPSERFRQRWTPCGRAAVHVLPAAGAAHAPALLRRVGQLLASRGTPAADAQA